MNKVICKRLEIILHSDVVGKFEDTTELKGNKNFTILPIEDIEYSSQTEVNEAGTILNETVTAKVKYSQDLIFFKALKYYILKLYTDTNSFFVGSPDYPTKLTYRNNNIYVNLTFMTSKPL